jgi:hypothetical protein
MQGLVPGDATMPMYPITNGSPFGSAFEIDGKLIATAISSINAVKTTMLNLLDCFIMFPSS